MRISFGLLAHPDTRGINDDQFPAIVFHACVYLQVALQALQEEGRDFRMVQDLETQ
jgi:hypothetical protein